jgi:molybdopterin converting factor subunit 1
MLHPHIEPKQPESDGINLAIMDSSMITVQLFASLKDISGQSSVDLPVSTQVTVEELFSELLRMFPELGRYRNVMLTAVNEEYATWETPVGPGDAVAFFPPVSGGSS